MKKLITAILILAMTINTNAQSFSSFVKEKKDQAKADSIAKVKKDTVKSKHVSKKN